MDNKESLAISEIEKQYQHKEITKKDRDKKLRDLQDGKINPNDILNIVEEQDIEKQILESLNKDNPLKQLTDILKPDVNLTQDHVDLILEAYTNEINSLIIDGLIGLLSKHSPFQRRAIQKRFYELRKDSVIEEEPQIKVPDESLELLTDPKLFNTITEDELDKKIVGEIDARKTIFLCSQGRLVKNSQPTSYNLLCNSESGAGKDHVSSEVLKLIPDEYCEKRTRISPTVFTYWHHGEPGWTWDGKVCYLEDISHGVFNHEVFKVMTSNGSKTTVIIEQKAVDLVIEGKPVMITTSASASPSPEMTRRFSLLPLDESVDQTIEIMKRHAEYAEHGISESIEEKYIECQRYLKRVIVKIPFAQKLVKIFPTSHVLMRTHFSRFLDYIKASTAFHQYQRQTDKEKNIIATTDDYNFARIALQKTTSNKFMIPLTKDDKRLLKIMEGFEIFVKIDDVLKKVSFMEERKLRRRLNYLTEQQFLEKSSEADERTGRDHITYKLIDIGIVTIPKWEDLETFFINNEEKEEKSDIIDEEDEPRGLNAFGDD